jgi:nucleobase:cation symporter-1, NCS1 family
MAVSVVQDAQLSRRVESRHIDHIPAGARHGQPWHQFAFWFGGNVNVFNVVIGAVTVSIGLTFWPALIAIAVGTLIGALLIALHATQGPRRDGPARDKIVRMTTEANRPRLLATARCR